MPSTSCGELRSRQRTLPLSLPCRDNQSSAGHGVCQSEFKQKAKLKVVEARDKHVYLGEAGTQMVIRVGLGWVSLDREGWDPRGQRRPQKGNRVPQVITWRWIFPWMDPSEEIVVRSDIHRLWDVPPPHCASCLTTPLVSDKERLRRRWGRM